LEISNEECFDENIGELVEKLTLQRQMNEIETLEKKIKDQ